MILGHHLIISAYGFWLPNDPRGSWSDFVGAWELLRFGRATKTECRASVAGRPHDRQSRLAAKDALQYPAVHFTGLQARAIARGFADFVRRAGLPVWACAILPEHCHLVVARHRYSAEQIINLLKGAASRSLVAEGLHPLDAYPTQSGRVPKAWARNGWKVFLDSREDVGRAVRYVESNPAKEGKRPQHWSFVAPLPAALPPGF
jgi:REP element-mobilizing transposase RayT